MVDEASILKKPIWEAVEDFYKLYYIDVYKYSLSLAANSYDADDITSNVFLEFYKKFESFEWRGISVKAWLLKAARFKFYNLIKQRTRLNIDTEYIEKLSDSGTVTDQNIINKLTAQTILRELSALNTDDREIITLRIWEGLKYHEIAEVVGSNKDAVKVRYYRIIKQLQRSLGVDQSKKKQSEVFSFILFFGELHTPSKTPALSGILSSGKVISSTLITKLVIGVVALGVISSTGMLYHKLNIRPKSRENPQTSSRMNSFAHATPTIVVSETSIKEVSTPTVSPTNTVVVTATPTKAVTPTRKTTATPSAAPTAVPTSINIGSSTYTDTDYSLAFTYPQSWNVSAVLRRPDCQSAVEKYNTITCSSITFYSPADKASLEVMIRLPGSGFMKPYSGSPFGPSIGSATMLERILSKNTPNPQYITSLYYNNGVEARFPAYGLTAYIHDSSGQNQQLTSEFITLTDQILLSIRQV